MFLKFFITGFVFKIIASIDDAFTRIPIISALAKSRKGKIAFSIGVFLSLLTALALTLIFSTALDGFAHIKYYAASLIIVIAIAIYFDLFSGKKRAKLAHRHHQKIIPEHKTHELPNKNFFKLVGIGFLIAFITVIDDTVVFIPLFLDGWEKTVDIIIGILTATVVQIILVIYFAEKIEKLKYRKEISAIGLIIIAILILFGAL